MVLERKDMDVEARPQMRGGKGVCSVTNLGAKPLQQHLRVLAEILIPAGASIGEHEHLHETEYYLITRGSGTVNDDGTLKKVKPGDVVITTGGAKHSIEADGGEDLSLIAVIVTDQ